MGFTEFQPGFACEPEIKIIIIKEKKNIMKFSQAISRVRWFSFLEINVLKTISVLVLRVVELMWDRGQRWSSKCWSLKN
jgi:hypothetical protein